MKIVEGLPPKGNGWNRVALDLEIFGAYKEQLHRPHGDFACLSVCGDGKTVYMVKKVSQIQEALERIDKSIWTFHNAAFDVPHLRRGARFPDRPKGLFWDTMIVERDLWGGEFDTFSLADLTRRWLSERLDKRDQSKFAEAEEMTSSMIKYAAKDVIVTWRVSEVQERFLQEDAPSLHVWEDIDAPAFWAIQAFKGFRLDSKKWLSLSSYFLDQATELEAKLGFNPRSPKETKEALAKRHIYVKDTNAKTLSRWEDDEVVQLVLQCREASKSASTYGEAFVKKYLEQNGYVYAMYEVTKALTGRLSSSDPNMQNIPRNSQFRACWIPSKGNIIIKADYSAQEPRITAALSGDRAMLAAFQAGEDIHLTSTRAIYADDRIDKKDPRRQDGKQTFLAVTYGQQAGALARSRGISEEDAGVFIERLKRRFPGVPAWAMIMRAQAKHTRVVRTLSGRRIWINNHMGYKAVNQPVNAPIQGSGADMMKMALAKIYDRSGDDYCLVATVHDEVDADCPKPKAAKMAKLIQKAMLDAFSEIVGGLVPGEVEVKIAKNWAGE